MKEKQMNKQKADGRLPVLELQKVSKKLKNVKVLKGVNLACYSGRIYGITGHNGSGKTVMFKCMCGLYRPDWGKVYVNGEPLGERMLPNAGIIIDSPAFLGDRSGFWNLALLYGLNHKMDREHIREMMSRVGLDASSKKPVRHYSLGMRQRLAIAQALMEDPGILILDEPMNGLDKKGVEEIRNLLLEEKQKGKTILLASHNREDIEILCDEVYEMEMGSLYSRAAADGSSCR